MGGNHIFTGFDWLRVEGRYCSAACVAAGGTSRGTFTCIGPDVGRYAQGGRLRVYPTVFRFDR